MSKLILLHGFLGDPDDWKEVISFLPDFECEALSYPFTIPREGILVAYSMGGRIASTYPHAKILISSHVGLVNEEEKGKRKEWIDILKHKPFSTFLKLWYEQPLFALLKKSPQFPTIFARRLTVNPAIALHQLESLPLANHSIPKNACFICGTQDLKYMNLYNQLSLNPLLVERSSHACHLEKPKRCAELIRICVERLRNLRGHQVPQGK